MNTHVMEKNWTLSVDQCQLQVLQFLVHLTNFLSVPLRCNSFTGIQKAVVNQVGSRPPNSDHNLFFGSSLAGKCFGASSQSSHWADYCWVLYKIHFWAHITIWSRNGSLLCRIREDDTSKWQFFFICSQLRMHPLFDLFHLSNFLQMPNDCRMINIEFLGNFLCSCKRISFNDVLSLVIVNFWWPTNVFLTFRALVSFAKLLEPPLLCTLISSSWDKCVVDIVSGLCCFTTHFELK